MGLGIEFVMGFITVIDGERDPRNLLLIFGMLPHFLATFPLGPLTEEMFEVISCYFPVDFYTVSVTEIQFLHLYKSAVIVLTKNYDFTFSSFLFLWLF